MTQFNTGPLDPADDHDAPAVETVIVPRARDLGGFEVRRALPSARRQMVGPFIFWDQMGPSVFKAGTGIDVRPHPHIGLATLTYLFEGQILHRDSLGVVQAIDPGEVNWMTAGRGIVHSERTAPEVRQTEAKLFGIQSWIALPERHEETDPGFAHLSAADLPTLSAEGKQVRLIAGSLWGETSPVRTFSEMVYADAALQAGAKLPIAAEHQERAIYVAQGSIAVGGEVHEPARLLVLNPGEPVTVTAVTDCRIMIFGGEPMDGPRYVWWNFVSRSKDRIEQAKADWRAGRFEVVPGESEFIPLPE
ncbi:pirin family protein [uncultured Alsobacter sp.]|uniref:pirin family protein n=1 Tax=uncultured Alsobacter sp. TaxID=1748258 RepID=UPI0025E63F1F|nr:pirin family protein [uncultured Alsobacter sp.]